MKILSAETNLASATSVNNSSVLRVFNSDSSNTMTVTRKTANGVTVGSFTIPSGKVTYCQKDYTDTIEGGANLKVSQVAFSPMMSFSSFGEAGPTYSYSVSASNVDEGGSFTTTITTTQVDDGTTLYWELSGTNVTSADFSSGALTGSVTISSNSASFSHTLDNDATTENVEIISIKLYTDSGRNTQVGNTATVTVADTSLTPTYSISLSTTSADEGGTITTTITTTNVADGTQLWWQLSGTGIAAGDFSSGALTGSVTISSNSASFSHTIAEDNTTEGAETLNIKFYSDSGYSTQVGSTATATINDTSVTSTTTYYSVDFDGNDNLSFPMNSSSMSWGASESVTLECWFKIDSFDSNTWHSLFGRWKAGEYCFLMEIGTNGETLMAIGNGSGYYASISGSSGAVQAGQWYHCAVVKNGSNGKIYLNGKEDSSTSSWSQACNNNTRDVVIGDNADGFGSYGIDGQIRDVRFVIGTAVYTSDFIPPTEPLTNITNTKLLCCQSSTITDFEVLNNGSAADTITAYGDPQSSEQNPFNGDWSLALDGNDGFRTGTSSDFLPGSSDFTIEIFVKFDSLSGLGVIIDSRSSSTQNTIILSRDASNYIYGANVGSSNNRGGPMYHIVKSTTQVTTGTWYHIAWTRSGSSNKLFINGILEDTYTDGNNYNGGPGYFEIGGAVHQTNYYTTGKLSNFRFTKGQALYTSSFTTPTGPLTTTSQGATASNVKFLGFNKPIYEHWDANSSGSFNTFTGNPVMVKDDPFDLSAAYLYSADFTGNGFLSMSASPDYNVGTDNFTIEMWVKGTSTSSQGSPSYIRMYQTDNPSTTYNANNSNQILQVTMQPGSGYLNTWSMGSGSGASVNILGSTNIMDGNWNHVATVRNGSTITQYVNGTAEGSANVGSATFDNNGSTGNRPRVGANNTSSGNATMKISNVRLTVGTALYTANFSVPTAHFDGSSGALVMCNRSSVTNATKAHSGYSITKTNTVASSTESPFS